jgi:hypothetical protein
MLEQQQPDQEAPVLVDLGTSCTNSCFRLMI